MVDLNPPFPPGPFPHKNSPHGSAVRAVSTFLSFLLPQQGRQCLHPSGQPGKFAAGQGLPSIGEGLRRPVMDLDHQSVRPAAAAASASGATSPRRPAAWLDRPAPADGTAPSGRQCPPHPAWPGCPSRRCGCPARRGSPAHCRRQGCIPPPAIAPSRWPRSCASAAPASPAAPAPAAVRNSAYSVRPPARRPPPGTAAAAGDR